VVLFPETLWKHLNQLGLQRDRVHDELGDVRSLLDTRLPRELCAFSFIVHIGSHLESARYLRRWNAGTVGEPRWTFARGARADLEMDPLQVLRFMYAAMGQKDDPHTLKARLVLCEPACRSLC
jgi:hypothetical protein